MSFAELREAEPKTTPVSMDESNRYVRYKSNNDKKVKNRNLSKDATIYQVVPTTEEPTSKYFWTPPSYQYHENRENRRNRPNVDGKNLGNSESTKQTESFFLSGESSLKNNGLLFLVVIILACFFNC